MIAVCKQGHVEAASPAWRYSILLVGHFIGVVFSLHEYVKEPLTFESLPRVFSYFSYFVSRSSHKKPTLKTTLAPHHCFICLRWGSTCAKKKNISSRIYLRLRVQIVNYGKHGVHDAWMEIRRACLRRFFVVVFFCMRRCCLRSSVWTSSHCPNTRELLFIGASAYIINVYRRLRFCLVRLAAAGTGILHRTKWSHKMDGILS